MDHVTKLLARIPEKHRRQVYKVLTCLADLSCRDTLEAEKLAGSRALYRVRAGRYRVIYHLDDHSRAIVDDIRTRNERTYRGV